jgi:hypothetical protein
MLTMISLPHMIKIKEPLKIYIYKVINGVTVTSFKNLFD